jgi:hypothetical protein
LYPKGEISQYVTDNIHGIEKVIFEKKHTWQTFLSKWM